MARSNRRRLAGVLALAMAPGLSALLAANPGVAHAQMTCDPCVIGVAYDGPWTRIPAMREAFEQEIAALAAPDFTVAFPDEAQLVPDWTLDGVQEAVETLLADPDIDILLTYGPVASSYAIQRGGLPKPVVSAFVLDPEAQGFPLETNAAGERVSGVPNLAYITFARDAAEEIRRLQEITAFSHLTYLASDALLAAVPEMEEGFRRGMRQFGGEATIVRVGTSIDAALAALSPATEAVYVLPLVQLPSSEFDRLVQALIDNRVPGFSSWGRSEVERGLLASVYRDTDTRRLGRRTALHVRRILDGEEAANLPVDFLRNQHLTLNMATARSVGIHPDWHVLTEAELLQNEPPNLMRRLDLASAARSAVMANLDLAARDRAVAAGRQAVRAAGAALRPQITLSGGVDVIDPDRSESRFGVEPVWQSAGGVGVSQLLWSDGARARETVERHAQTSREQSRAELRLDVAHDAAMAYLGVLRTRAYERIERDNLAVTRSNLELARSRQRIGVARAAEVIRWENQIALDRRAVIEAGAMRNVVEIELNRLLHRPLEEPFATAEVDLDDPALLARTATVDNYFDNPAALAVFRDFMAAEALDQSPELRQIDADIAARERTVLAADRAFWAPTVAAGSDVSAVHRAGEVADLPIPISRPNGFNWSAGVSATLPLFAGGALRAERTRSQEQLAELRLDRRAMAERIEQQLRATLLRAGASYAGIDLAGDAADAARRNLSLVTDAYEQGAVSILDLIDAQTAARVADQSAATAVYDYLSDLMDMHRASGRFGLFMEPAELAAFADRLRAFFEASGYEHRVRP